MATFRKRNDKWQAQIRIIGRPSQSKSFYKKSDALKWATHLELLAQNNLPWEPRASQHSFKSLIKRYLKKVTPHKKNNMPEIRRLERLMKDQRLSTTPLHFLTPPVLAEYRDQRLLDGTRACQYDLILIRHAWNIAKIEWGWDLPVNPVSLIRLPRNNPPRERRLRKGEY